MKPMNKPLFWVQPNIENVVSPEDLKLALNEVLEADLAPFPLSKELKQKIGERVWANRYLVLKQMLEDVEKQLEAVVETQIFRDHLSVSIDLFMEKQGFVPPKDEDEDDE